ncbi:hypothetical protein [Bacillus toyonensis]|uniref:hypothetical protein n=1 Tax=Bacillus toyonensis TaxID=155322 RepID=UPI000BF02273|nr:hypothetical protein [Bacillus toyonensis]PEK73150.1 hypothetical protein CN594_34565 [Bacillus toyonensis]PEO46680.1 hypothetical protein CN579_30875 [Bacillus toyonensis]PFY28594.1 hypothetical protein COL54_34415 [Bacillus toyonensis]PFY35807.1 hypothetical protein COL55_30360 [Bacillus toyonensis]PFY53831.1 hypothetical protein COL62_34745 [Bacillus toyonensis]
MNQHKKMSHDPHQDRYKSNCHNTNHPSNSEGPYTEQGPTIFRSNYLLDAWDNPVIEGVQYTLAASVEYSDRKQPLPMNVASSWGANWLYTSPTPSSTGIPIKFSQYKFSSGYPIELGQMTWIQVSSPDYNPQNSYLGPNITWGGVQLGARGGEPNNEEWYPYFHSTSSTSSAQLFSFKNAYTDKYLRNLGPDKWAEADGVQGNDDTRFVLYRALVQR